MKISKIKDISITYYVDYSVISYILLYEYFAVPNIHFFYSIEFEMWHIRIMSIKCIQFMLCNTYHVQ